MNFEKFEFWKRPEEAAEIDQKLKDLGNTIGEDDILKHDKEVHELVHEAGATLISNDEIADAELKRNEQYTEKYEAFKDDLVHLEEFSNVPELDASKDLEHYIAAAESTYEELEKTQAARKIEHN